MRKVAALLVLSLLTSLIVTGTTPAPAAAADPAFRSVGLTDANPVVTTGKCTQIALTGRIIISGTDWSTISTVVRTPSGDDKQTLGVRLKESGPVTAISDRVRLCGYDTGLGFDDAGRYTWTVSVDHPGGTISVQRSFRLRYQGVVALNATPEPVRRGGWVNLKAWVSDGWEDIDHHRIALYFRRDGSPAWVRRGTMVPHCRRYCGEIGFQEWDARTRRHQSVPGTWRAVSLPTTYLAIGYHSDHVTVRG
ncbi:hypothetical protein [Actinoplanes sp. N902-109]|uniref:hypothetical protein n=1 Tax=Actinoplanes sp. (strain N902-109) TaxID=649831 RepID=UPI0003293EC8|nr:hypothetical protein [Actinoplanes sp. N902-109]AGL15682.1 hypothetical protein L083_2172 [Actinoplanes sp. N902-109]